MNNFVIISGCSAGGKSTLLGELSARGHAIIPEPGRRIVAQQMESGGEALPWRDAVGFCRRALELSLRDYAEALPQSSWVFFDRGLIDAAVALEHLTGEATTEKLGRVQRFHRTVFLAPPWPEIYVLDTERQHGFIEAEAEYKRLQRAFLSFDYDVMELPKASVKTRADFVIATLEKRPV